MEDDIVNFCWIRFGSGKLPMKTPTNNPIYCNILFVGFCLLWLLQVIGVVGGAGGVLVGFCSHDPRVQGDILLDGDDLDLLCSGLTVAECLGAFCGFDWELWV